jgi:hypothetical protein
MGMRRLALPLLAGGLALVPVLPLSPVLCGTEAWAKPQHCFAKAEIAADLIVRHGVFLRESSRRCDDTRPGTKKMWEDFDKAFGSRLLSQRTRRENAFKREFPQDWLKALTTFDARLVTYERNLYDTPEFCSDIEKLLKTNQKSGWSSFVKQSKTLKSVAVLDIKPCD